MTHPAIRPTVTHKVRAFMAAEGEALRPWAGLNQTYAGLFSLLTRRRSDPSFWGPLSLLLEEVVEDAASGGVGRGRLPAPGAELLSRWEVEDLVRDLRAALPGMDPASPPQRWHEFTSGLSATVLGGFLLLGLAATGCAAGGGSEAPAGDSHAAAPEGSTTAVVASASERTPLAEPPREPEAAPTAACSLPSTSVLRRTIESSSLPEAQRVELCRCFASLEGNWSDGLTELFERASAAEIAAALEAMVDRCGQPDPSLGENFAEVTDQRLGGRPLPEPPERVRPRQPRRPAEIEFAPLYKGVSFRQG